MTKAFSFTATAKALALVPLMSSRQITVAPLGLPDIKPPQVKLPLTEWSCALLASWPKYPKPLARRSKDQCEQLNDAYSDHQHGKC
jgi:hypothetical protein